jgi:imidazoleglycerol-phosphate dehydratase
LIVQTAYITLPRKERVEVAQKIIAIERKTKETDISLKLSFLDPAPPSIDTSLPFFDHLLTAMAFHGGFALSVSAAGDIEVDPHHLVEDVGIVLGDAIQQHAQENGPLHRFGHSIIPMDEALAEAVVDLCGRPTLVYNPEYPQPYAGEFDISLLREFLSGFTGKGRCALHGVIRSGENSHHMAEALFKALGKALGQACRPLSGDDRGLLSTKGLL